MVVRTLIDLGGEAERRAIFGRARELADFSAAQRAVPPPPRNRGGFHDKIGFELSFALSRLKKAGQLKNPHRGVWRLPATVPWRLSASPPSVSRPWAPSGNTASTFEPIRELTRGRKPGIPAVWTLLCKRQILGGSVSGSASTGRLCPVWPVGPRVGDGLTRYWAVVRLD